MMTSTHPMRTASMAVVALVTILGVTGCGHLASMIHGTGAEPPAASEFGLGPRASAHGLYTATLQPVRPIRPRQMQTVRVALKDAGGSALDGAVIEVDGGMPQHGHGLPTRPRVTKSLGGGVYEIEGVRFNMGGWWEFTLAITAASGPDRVTFNLDL